jgi:hypothetical protein
LSKDVTYLPDMAADYLFKPNGLWYAMDNEWKTWCDKNNVEIFTSYRYSYELDVDMRNVCVLNDVEPVVAFHRKYGFVVSKGNFTAIDWKKVKADYSGIEVRNYEELNFACSFYAIIWLRNWAVSGGCMWDLSAMDVKLKRHVRSDMTLKYPSR